MDERYGFHTRMRVNVHFTVQDFAVRTDIGKRCVIIDRCQRADAQVVQRVGQLAEIDRVGGTVAPADVGNLVVDHIQTTFGRNHAGKFRGIRRVDADGAFVLIQDDVFACFKRDGRAAGDFFQRMVVCLSVGTAGGRRNQFE